MGVSHQVQEIFRRVALANFLSSSSVGGSGGCSRSLRGTAFSASLVHGLLRSSMRRMPRPGTSNVDGVAGDRRELLTLFFALCIPSIPGSLLTLL